MFNELKLIDNKICAWSDVYSKYIPIVLCHECKQKHGVPGMYGFICNKCQNKETI
jgi:hypothetical protein